MNPELSVEMIQNKIIEFCVFVHHNIEQFTELYYSEQKRHNCVTPTLYLNLLKLFIEVL